MAQQVGDEARYAVSTSAAVEDGGGNGQQSRPSRGVFDLLGVMEIEHMPEEDALHASDALSAAAEEQQNESDENSAASVSASASDEDEESKDESHGESDDDEECCNPDSLELSLERRAYKYNNYGISPVFPAFNPDGQFLDDDEECGNSNTSEGFNSHDTHTRYGIGPVFPAFNSKGKFVDYETRATGGDQEIQQRAAVLSGRFKDDDDGDGTMPDELELDERLDERKRKYSVLLSRKKKRDRKYAIMSIILVFIVGSIFWIAAAWDDNEDQQDIPSSTEPYAGQEDSQVVSASSPEYVGQETQMYHVNSKYQSLSSSDEDVIVDEEKQLLATLDEAQSDSSSSSLHNPDPHTHPKKEHEDRKTKSPTKSPTPSPVVPPSYMVTAAAVGTVKKSDPTNKWAGLEELCIEKDERISYVRFDWPSTLFSSQNDVMVKAVLQLYLKTHHTDDGVTTVLVDALPHGGTWTDESLSWLNQPPMRKKYNVGSFDATEMPSGVTKQLYEVDVSSAITDMTKDNMVTFKLHTEESSGDLFFASKKWKGGEAVPELKITYLAA